MKYINFQQSMKKPLFTWEEAKIVAHQTPSATLRQQLHQWTRQGQLKRLRRGLYAFARAKPDPVALAKLLYTPAYFSLEYALNYFGIMTEAVFVFTLVSPKATRTFQTPWGNFQYHQIKKPAFRSYDPGTLMATPEKALLDYLYLHRHRLEASSPCWQEQRWEGLEGLDWKILKSESQYFANPKLKQLLESLKDYAISNQHTRRSKKKSS